MSAVLSLPFELEIGRMEELLGLWARWMRSSQPYRDLWYPDGAAGCVGGGYSQTFEDMLEAAESRSAEALGAAIDGLPADQQCAVFHVHLHAVYRFRASVEVIYEKARDSLRVVLPARGIY